MRSAGQAPAAHVEPEILAPDIVGLDERENQAPPAIQTTESQKITSEETPLRVDQHLRQAAALAAVVERLRHEVGVARHTQVMVGETSVRIVLEMPAEFADGPGYPRILVDLVPAPAAAPSVEETDEPIRISVSMAQEAAKIIGDPRHRPPGESRKTFLPESFDFGTQVPGHTLVGVETQDPVVSGALYGELFLRAVTRPVTFNDARTAACRQLASGVGGVRVHDDDFIAEADGLQTRFDPIGFVVGDDASRQPAPTRHAQCPYYLVGALEYPQ